MKSPPAKTRRYTASWARLISEVVHVDPLTCANVGVAISKILDHLGLGPPETTKPRRRYTRSCALR